MSPIFERELGRALRRVNALRSRFLTALFAVFVSSLFILLGAGGRFLCSILGWTACFLIVVETVAITSNLFTEDRRNGTLGLIFLAGISPAEMFWARLGGASVVSLQKLLALVPLLSVPFLMGGVPQEIFWGMIAAIPVLFLFVLSVCVLASLMASDDAAATLIAMIIGGVVCLATPAYYFADKAFGGRIGGGDSILWFSPAYGPCLLQAQLSGGGLSSLWLNFASTLSWAAIFISVSGWLLKRSLVERVESPMVCRWREFWRRFVHGDKHWRQQAGAWLDENPFMWLAAYDRQPVTLAWAIIGLIAAGWLFLWWLWPNHWPSIANLYLTALLMNCAIGALSGYATAKRISEDRRSGILEILLTTPVATGEIVIGQLAASTMQLRPICRMVFSLNVLMMSGGLLTRSWSPKSLLTYAICWAFLLMQAWSLGGANYRLKAMWAGLNSGQPSYAIKAELTAIGGQMFNLLFNFRFLSTQLAKFPTGSTTEVVIVSFVAVIGLVIILFFREETPLGIRLVNEMRSICEEPVPAPGDPRFKNWRLNTRLGETGTS